jgi:hypothetical protein
MTNNQDERCNHVVLAADHCFQCEEECNQCHWSDTWIEVDGNPRSNRSSRRSEDMTSFEDMVTEVIGWYLKSPDKTQIEFQRCDELGLYQYHHSIGRDIRNHFKLWEIEWQPVIVDGIDEADDHPDAVSMKIIKEVWRRVQ